MELPKDDSFQSIKIKRYVDGHTGDDGNWVPAGNKLIATGKADIQPKSGQQRAAELKTEYESDHKLFAGTDDIIFESDLLEDEKKIFQGDIVIDGSDQKYKVVYPGNWSSHYEMDLKKEK